MANLKLFAWCKNAKQLQPYSSKHYLDLVEIESFCKFLGKLSFAVSYQKRIQKHWISDHQDLALIFTRRQSQPLASLSNHFCCFDKSKRLIQQLTRLYLHSHRILSHNSPRSFTQLLLTEYFLHNQKGFAVYVFFVPRSISPNNLEKIRRSGQLRETNGRYSIL